MPSTARMVKWARHLFHQCRFSRSHVQQSANAGVELINPLLNIGMVGVSREAAGDPLRRYVWNVGEHCAPSPGFG